MLTQETVASLNDMRLRVVRAKQLKAQGELVPDGLMPSEEELREALKMLRADRMHSAASAPKGGSRTKATTAQPTFDLNSLFDM
jgi:hypothetical protein